MNHIERPLPVPTPASRAFWEAAKHHELKVQCCNDCRKYIFYPRELCPDCFSTDLGWARVSGKGVVHSYTIAHMPPHPAFASDVPFIIAMVELEEGPRMMTNIVGCKPKDVEVGMQVVATFDDVSPEITLVKFRPA
jgi:uncharacterized OB-fold protein